MGARILIVGDGPEPALAGALEGLGHAVCGAAPPDGAVERAAALGPDLALVDVDGEAGAAGIEAAEGIGDRCGVPVVCLVNGTAADAAAALLRPERTTVPFGFVVRPVDPRQLRLSIDGALALHARARPAGDADRRTIAELRRNAADLERDAAVATAVVESMDQAVVAVDMSGAFLLSNAAAQRFVGDRIGAANRAEAFRAVSAWKLDGRTPFPEEDLPLSRALRGESSNDVELLVRRSGRAEDVRIRVDGRALRNAEGDQIGGVILLRDVTRVKETEQRLRQTVGELRRQRQLMEAVLQSMHDGVIAVDAEGRRLFANAAARRFFDMETGADLPLDDRLRGHGIFHPDGVTRYPVEDIPISRALRGEASAGVELFLRNPRRPEGLFVSISGAPTRDESGAVREGVVVIHDLTETKKREGELKRALAELHARAQLIDAVLNHMSDGLVVADRDGRFTLINRSAARIAGVQGTVAPTSEWAERYGLFHPDRVTRFAEEDLPLVRAVRGEPTDGVNMFVRNANVPDGVFVSVDGRPLRNEAGDLTGGIAVMRDLTQQVVAGEALAQAFASGRLDAVDTILHNIGNAVNSVAVGADTLHGELNRNVLTGRLRALADAVEAQGDGVIPWLRDDPRGRKALPLVAALARDFADQNDRLLRSADRVRQRVRHIVDIIRTQKPHSVGPVHQKVVELRRQIGDAFKVIREGLAQRGIHVEVDCARAPREIRIHESRFQQMLVNLFRNAMEAIDERSARIGFDGGEAPRVRVEAYIESGRLVIDVIDNGIGASADQLRSMFTAGYTTKDFGSGLGLHSAANFVIGAGGSIRGLSEGVGRGATLRVALRLPDPPAGPGAGGPAGAGEASAPSPEPPASRGS